MQAPNRVQIEFWNGQAGQKWAALWTGIDVMLAPVSTVLLDALGNIEGSGSSTSAAARARPASC